MEVFTQTLVEQDFAPVVTATCKAGFMTIKVATNQTFVEITECANGESVRCALRWPRRKLCCRRELITVARSLYQEMIGQRLRRCTLIALFTAVIVLLLQQLFLSVDPF
ncbi:hypothetical protein J6590_023071 [Homalodisca vitripennis]|nr:hypothetical protein J6590_023071 [Homalodisca vitripennis]